LFELALDEDVVVLVLARLERDMMWLDGCGTNRSYTSSP
jgi:hypothetical protein